MSDITLFSFEGSQVRVIMDEKGEPWFVANDIAAALGYEDARRAVVQHVDDDDRAERPVIDSMGRNQRTNCTNESGMYSLIMGSRLEGAKRFKRWVTSEVLPSIRKTGSYSHVPAPPSPQYALKSEAESKAAIIRDTVTWMREMMPSIRPEMASACTARALVASGLMSKSAHEELRNMLVIETEKAPMFTPTQLGEKLGGVKPGIVNKMLEARGLQKKFGKRWEPTEQGRVYSGAVSFQAEHNEHKGYQIKWSAEVLELLEQPLEQALAATKSKLLT